MTIVSYITRQKSIKAGTWPEKDVFVWKRLAICFAVLSCIYCLFCSFILYIVWSQLHKNNIQSPSPPQINANMCIYTFTRACTSTFLWPWCMYVNFCSYPLNKGPDYRKYELTVSDWTNIKVIFHNPYFCYFLCSYFGV